jgi:outer membrane protein assembly factor BamA
MHSACHQVSTPSHAIRFCGSLLFLLLSSFLTTNAFARDSTGNKADTSSGGIRTPKIDFVGNTAFSSEKLLKVLLNARPRWFTESGTINPNALRLATDILTAFYYDDGFLNVQVNEPQIASDDRATIAIYEGPVYRVGSIAIEGQLRFPRRDVESQLTMWSGQPFRGSTLQRNVLALSDFYSDRGFAYVNVDPRTNMDSERHLVNVKVFIKPGDETRIDQITISGNTTTPEQVIRAALRFHEHELYSARAIRESMARLKELGLIPKITTQPSTKPDEINVRVTIVEKSKSEARSDARLNPRKALLIEIDRWRRKSENVSCGCSSETFFMDRSFNPDSSR